MTNWHELSADETLTRLKATPTGLAPEEVSLRRSEWGPNEIVAGHKDGAWTILFRQLRDPLIYILIVAAGLSLALGDLTDAAVIAAVIILNTIIGFVQEIRAQEAMKALADLGAPKATVLRKGGQLTIAASELVPGDIVLLTSGDKVPADLRLLQDTSLDVDESSLTGESAPVRKDHTRVVDAAAVVGDRVNLAFASTTVRSGRARGIVVTTGSRTEVGQIAEVVRTTGDLKTPLQEDVHKLGTIAGIAVLVLSGFAAIIGLMRGIEAGEILLTAVAITVAAIPEGLPVVLTITFAAGVRRMAQRGAIIRRLPAVETLGRTTVVASDKTGTLTRNEMTVRSVWADGSEFQTTGFGEGDIRLNDQIVEVSNHPALEATLVTGTLANEAPAGVEEREIGDPTEVAILIAARKGGVDPVMLRETHQEIALRPFEPENQWMASLNRHGDSSVIHLKGSPEAVLARCVDRLGTEGHAPLDREEVLRGAGAMAGRGLRVLATARKEATPAALDDAELAGGFSLCGLIAMEDPIREEAVESVSDLRSAGMRVLMITGDHRSTAEAIGRQLGLAPSGKVIEGREIDSLSTEALDSALAEGVDVFARVSPSHKHRIVEQLRARGEIVAVTGDGVNDAPALRAAHLGIAMGASGTDVAREASDMVLADDNFATIRAAVEEGRVVFSNVRKVTFFLLSSGVGLILALLISLIAGWPLPFVAAQILWVNLVTNGLQDVALALEPAERGLMKRPPRKGGEGILSRRLLGRMAAIGALIAAGTLGMFWLVLEATGDLERARTIAMTQVVLFQLFHVFNCRSLDRSAFTMNPFTNRFLFASQVAAILAQLAVVYWGPLQSVFRTVPLSLSDWGLMALVASSVVVGGELDKIWNRRHHHPLG